MTESVVFFWFEYVGLSSHLRLNGKFMLIPTFFCFWLEFEPELSIFLPFSSGGLGPAQIRLQCDRAIWRGKWGAGLPEVPTVLLSAGWCEGELPRRNENGFQPSG